MSYFELSPHAHGTVASSITPHWCHQHAKRSPHSPCSTQGHEVGCDCATHLHSLQRESPSCGCDIMGINPHLFPLLIGTWERIATLATFGYLSQTNTCIHRTIELGNDRLCNMVHPALTSSLAVSLSLSQGPSNHLSISPIRVTCVVVVRDVFLPNHRPSDKVRQI